jgi:D-alanine-D-alanine ligase
MKRVTVLRGGPSEEYSVSMKTGVAVIEALKKLGYAHKDVVITKYGEWLHDGFVRKPESVLDSCDVVFVGLHGRYGEDGQVQRILQQKNIPFTGSRAMTSAIAFNKEFTKNTLQPLGIKMPKHRRVNKTDLNILDEEVEFMSAEMGTEFFIKPLSSGSSVGAKYAPSKQTLKIALSELLSIYDSVLVEEYIRGREATVGILSNFRNEKNYVLPVIEIVPRSGQTFFSNEEKYSGFAEEIVPGRFSYNEKNILSQVASLVHTTLGCDNYSRSDFIVRNGEVYFLEINTLPGLTHQSLFPKAAAAVGLDFDELVRHLVETARV